MTRPCLRWIRLALAFLVLMASVSGARAGDAYKPTPAAASPAKPSKGSDDVEPASDDSTMEPTDESGESTAPTPPKVTRPRPKRGNSTLSPTDSAGGDDAQKPTEKPAAQAADSDRAERAMWEEEARKADERVAAAQARLEDAQLAYTSMRMRSYPSGDARAAILKEIDDAKTELTSPQLKRTVRLSRTRRVPREFLRAGSCPSSGCRLVALDIPFVLDVARVHRIQPVGARLHDCDNLITPAHNRIGACHEPAVHAVASLLDNQRSSAALTIRRDF